MTDLTNTATKTDVEQAILKKLEKVKGPDHQGNYTALCPFHNDHNTPNLSVNFEKQCYNCFACDSSGPITRLAQMLGVDNSIYSNKGISGYSIGGKACPSVQSSQKHVQNASTPPVSTSVNGVNIESIAEAKNIPVDFLKGLGISDFKYGGQPAVKIPYYGEDGSELAVRYRLAITGDNRFKWRKGDRPLPYGLNRLSTARKAGWVMIVEGESDCWTCWFHDIPALGAPGKGIWPASWGEYLSGLDIYVWQEPGAEDFILRILKSAPGLRFIQAPEGVKDISEAHIQDLNVATWLKGLKSKAKSGQELKNRRDNEKLGQLYQEAKEVIESDNPLRIIETAIRDLGYGGDIKPALITYLAATSRLLEMRPGAMPVHLILIGPSSGGKSYTLNTVRRLMPSECFHVIDAGSPRALIYDEAPLEHKVLIFGEADSLPAGEDNPAASAIRNLLQDHQLHYEVTVKEKETGEYTTKKIERDGPTVLITTSTRSLGDQLMTRLFTLEIGDSREQISAALETQAGLEIGGIIQPDAGLVAYQAYLQMKSPVKVIVPYAGELARGMSKMAAAPRINRDFARLISLIKAVVLIRCHHRNVDSEGRIIAETADYETVRELVNDMYINSSSGVSNDVKNIVQAVISLNTLRNEGERITNTVLAKHLDIGVKQAERRAKRALKHGWLINQEQRKHHPADYKPGEPMPEVDGLPILSVDTVDIVDTERVQDFSYKNEGLDTLTPLTERLSTQSFLDIVEV